MDKLGYEIWIALIYILAIATVLRIFLRENRTPTSRMAWIVVVAAMPVLGTICYFLLGEVSLGRKLHAKLDIILTKLRKSVDPQILGKSGNEIQPALTYPAAFDMARSFVGLGVLGGNKAELMDNNAETLKRMIADFDAAKKQIHIMYYIWLEDHTGLAVADALIRASKRGVKVRAMADGLGSRKIIAGENWQRMIDAGIDARVALPLKGGIFGLLLTRVDLRNHRKITLIDGKITYCGSQNCSDAEFLEKPKYAPWVDIMTRWEGPVVDQMQLTFISDWMLMSDETLEDCGLFDADPKAGDIPALVLPDGPTGRASAMQQLLQTMFALAQEEIVISTPYFVPNAGLVDMITAAAYRGVRVRMIFPHRNDSFIVAATSQSYYRTLLESGVEIYEYKPGLLHAKTTVIDRKLSFIGSTNLDLRSFDLNYENNILFEDKTLSAEIHQRQLDYIDASVEISKSDVENWSRFKRIKNNSIAMLSPIL